MYKRIALTAIIALTALTGCAQGETTEPVAQTTQDAETTTEQTTANTEAAKETGIYELTDDNGTVYTLDLNPYSDENTEAADKAIAEAMAYETGGDADELLDAGITEWASLTIDNTNSDMESGITYVDIQIVGDEMQYGIITDPSDYVAELTWMSAYGDQADADTYNNMLHVEEPLEPAETIKPGVKETYPIVLGEGLPETIDNVWCWDQEMTQK